MSEFYESRFNALEKVTELPKIEGLEVEGNLVPGFLQMLRRRGPTLREFLVGGNFSTDTELEAWKGCESENRKRNCSAISLSVLEKLSIVNDARFVSTWSPSCRQLARTGAINSVFTNFNARVPTMKFPMTITYNCSVLPIFSGSSIASGYPFNSENWPQLEELGIICTSEETIPPIHNLKFLSVVLRKSHNPLTLEEAKKAAKPGAFARRYIAKLWRDSMLKYNEPPKLRVLITPYTPIHKVDTRMRYYVPHPELKLNDGTAKVIGT
ncbi:uncharacterized protein DFL_001328 [Arthrobotrys flagrans]|uniref:Uncharacterized protein n=1 Tax=Arthrobotrys flagrans TaxID=97331 RepID=A0A437AH19_ARTFL|nr:hypothetical protein DFL_001328 [Arthrobotrys flagrans]